MAAPAGPAALDTLESQILQNKDNLTALRLIRAPSFVESPQLRGTTAIIYSCVVTLIACIYTSLHLNVPTRSGLANTIVYKGKWVVIGLIAPELVLYLAISQFLEARALVRDLNRLLDERKPKPGDLEAAVEKPESGSVKRDPTGAGGDHVDGATQETPRNEIQEAGRKSDAAGSGDGDSINPAGVIETINQTDLNNLSESEAVLEEEDATNKQDTEEDEATYRFDLKYGFFVVMGGLEVPVHDIEPRSPKAARGLQFSSRLRLTAAGVLQLARDGHFLRIPRSKIDDKSKADVIQKILVMTQVTWMATQCIARKIYGLPLTLLEVHTMVHVVCAVVLFALWISKPKDVQDPELLVISGFEDLIALMYQESLVSDRVVNPYIPMSMRGKNQSTPPRYPYGQAQKMLYPRVPDGDAEASTLHVHRVTGLLCLQFGQKFPFGLGIIRRDDQHNLGGPECFNKVDIVRWERIISAIERIDGPILRPQRYATHVITPRGRAIRYPDRHYHEAFSSQLGNIRPDRDLSAFLLHNVTSRHDFYRRMLVPWQLVTFISQTKLLLLLILTLPAVYGGIHLAALNFGFPSAVEALLWKVSSIYIMVALPAMIAFSHSLDGWLYYKWDPPADAIPKLVSYLGGLGVLLGYVLARTFLVAESFASLRAEPIGVFWTPAWLQMIPHI